MKLGDIVTLKYGNKAGRPHVVVHEPEGCNVQLCYCGSGRWYMPEWHPVEHVETTVRSETDLRRCRRLLLAVKPDADGWKRIQVGRHGWKQPVIVGHVDVPWSWQQ